MNRIFILAACLLLSSAEYYAQSLYSRKWSALIPITEVTTKPFTTDKKLVRISAFVTTVHPKTGNLYVVNSFGNSIYEYTQKNNKPTLIYKFPENHTGTTVIENLTFDKDNHLIFSGRTVVENFATTGAYSEKLIFGVRVAPSYIKKISLKGDVIWATYFHDIPTTAASLTVDEDNNIYVLNKRNKNTVASPTYFQKNGDLNSSIEYQDVISKLDKDGKHLWSTFYTQNASSIKSIVAGKTGLYIYGDHVGATIDSTYFGTPNSHLEKISRPNAKLSNVFSVFLSKFSFEGTRLWSTYVGEHNTNVALGGTLMNNNSLTVVNDEPYILTTNKIFLDQKRDIATTKSLYKKPFSQGNTNTVTKFNAQGKMLWNSFVQSGDYLFSNGNELIISSTIAIDDNNLNSPDILKPYQAKFGGNTDVYTTALSLDGTTLNYGSFYGFAGSDSGVTIPTSKGFYILGNTDLNTTSKTLFSTSKGSGSELSQKGDVYIGDFISYFKRKGK